MVIGRRSRRSVWFVLGGSVMRRLILGSSMVAMACFSFALLAFANPAMRIITDEEAAALYGGSQCQYTPTADMIKCGNDLVQDQDCKLQTGYGTTDGGKQRRQTSRCSDNQTDVCGTVYTVVNCG